MAKKLLTDWVVDRWVNLELFNRKQEQQPNGCINWTGVQNNIGYGFVGFNYPQGKTSAGGHRGGMMTAHRLAFMLTHNRLPKTRNVNHTCHNKLCVNPDHLVEGTQRDKLDAMIKDGIKGGCVAGVKRGPYNHKQMARTYKYSEEEIQWIRTATTDEICVKYNIDKKHASRKQSMFRHGYKWLPCPK